jgi:cobalt-zinc-cadmium efflux system membrane fusion protein
MRNKILYTIAAIAFAAAVTLFMMPKQTGALSEEEHEPEPFVLITPQQIEEHAILIVKAEPGKVQTRIAAPARIHLNQDKVMHLVPKVSGIVREANRWVGEPVAQGEILAVFESSDMAVAKSKYLDALKKETLALANLEREKRLHEKQISSLQDYQNGVAEAESAKIELELARQQLHTMGLNRKEIESLPQADVAHLRRYELKSPMRGVIIERAVTKGEQIDTTREIYVIGDPTSLWAESYLFPSDFALLDEGLELELVHPNGKSVQAKVISISPNVDPTTGALRVYAEFENSDGIWRQGTYVQAELKGKAKQVALAVPKEAIQQIEGESILFVRTEEGFELRPVKTGLCDDKCVEILFGLQAGESYAAKNSFILKADHGKHEAEHMD